MGKSSGKKDGREGLPMTVEGSTMKIALQVLLASSLFATASPAVVGAPGGGLGCLLLDGFESGDLCAWTGGCPAPVPSAGASAEIQTARNAPDGTVAVAVSGALVTYVKEAIGGDQGGFFVQAELTGPALFVAVDPAALSPAPAPGDVVSFTITEMGTLFGLREALAVDGWSVSGSGAWLLCYRQEVSEATDLVSDLVDYESELVSLHGRIAASFGFAGTGFESAQLETAGVVGEGNLRLRVPVAVKDSLDLTTGCDVVLAGSPLWRFDAISQPSAWVPPDLSVISCPPFAVTGTTPASNSDICPAVKPGVSGIEVDEEATGGVA